MSAPTFAVSGHARAVASWLNLVERLVVGADDQLAAAWHSSQRPAAGGSMRDWESCAGPSSATPTVTRRNAGGLRHVLPSEDIGPSQPAAEVSALVSEGAVGALR
jgi:hypothetical protein